MSDLSDAETVIVDPGPVVGANEDELQPTMYDMLYSLLADLSDIAECVDKGKVYTVENQPGLSWASFSKLFERDQICSSDLQSMYKRRVAESMRQSVRERKPIAEPICSGNGSLELSCKILEQVKEERESIQKITTELSQLRTYNRELERKSEELLKLMSARKTSGEMSSTIDWDQVTKKVTDKRRKLVRDVRHVANHLCPNSDIEDILAKALKASTSGQNPYIDVPGSSQDVEFLLRCNLVTRHPHDRHLIRLFDLQ